MGESGLGPWEPLGLAETVDLFADAPFRWWIGGGLALELHVGRSWREHSDTDVGLVRSDAPQLVRVLRSWDVHLAAGGRLSAWTGGALSADGNENNLWCRRDPDSPWVLDVTIGDGDDRDWIFRRDPRVRSPWSEAVLISSDGVPYLAPALQLLFKSRDPRAKDDMDAREVIPALDADHRARLAQLVPVDHPWQSLLRVDP